jgi:alkylation response protein AidB-like acyl-CoA dehydrogenase
MTIDLNPSEDQRGMLDAARTLLAQRFPVSRLRGDAADPLAGDAADALAGIAAFGGLGVAAPEELGGTGLTVLEEALLHVEFGRHLIDPGALAAAIGARLAAGLGRRELAAQAVAGEARFALAHPAGNGVQLLAAAGARYALTWRSGCLRLIDLARLAPVAVQSIDESLPLSRAVVTGDAVIGTLNDAPLARHADLLVSAQLLGIAEATRDMAVAYAGVRQQFGQPIGAFQGVKHHCADMAIRAEMVSAQLVMAALAERDGRSDAAFQTAALRLLAPRVALDNARTNIQVHGAIGFSAECDAHLYVKRAHALARIGGGTDLLDLHAPLAAHPRP